MILIFPQDAEREILLVSAEKDKAIQDLKDALTNSGKEISTRYVFLNISFKSHVDCVIELIPRTIWDMMK